MVERAFSGDLMDNSELSRIPLIILMEENMKGGLPTQGGDACLPLHSLLWFPL